MRIGISVAQCGRLAQPAAVSAAARAAEQLGYSSVWVCGSILDPVGVLAATAAITSRVGLGASLVDGLGSTWAMVRDLAAGHGRDPDLLRLVVRAGIALSAQPVDGPRPSFSG